MRSIVKKIIFLFLGSTVLLIPDVAQASPIARVSRSVVRTARRSVPVTSRIAAQGSRTAGRAMGTTIKLQNSLCRNALLASTARTLARQDSLNHRQPSSKSKTAKTNGNKMNCSKAKATKKNGTKWKAAKIKLANKNIAKVKIAKIKSLPTIRPAQPLDTPMPITKKTTNAITTNVTPVDTTPTTSAK